MTTVDGGMADSSEDDKDFVPHWEALSGLLDQMEDALYSYLQDIAARDLFQLLVKGREYGPSWKSRGGAGAFYMLARKWDRLQHGLGKSLPGVERFDLFAYVEQDDRAESFLDDIGDLRRYLFLVEAEIRKRRWEKISDSQLGTVTETHDPTGMERPFGFDPKEDSVGSDLGPREDFDSEEDEL